MALYSLDKLIAETRRLAAEYRRTTGKTLGGVSGEIAQYDAARLLGLELVQGHAGYDAVGRSGEREGRRYQVKGRTLFDHSRSGQRIGQLKVDQEWDAVLLVLMDEEFSPTEIYEADRQTILQALAERADSKRGKRGAMSVARFKHIGTLVWDALEGEVEDEIWEHGGLD
ncbi:MAG TPA: hypothetical protein ENK54_07525 [Thiotrichales bacterium]|nr:hypothetical protein [Thiotrichales bacterium]